ncbi:hypothetical protein ACET3X_003276 [Alternaria dauci]|uniref:Zn(2)-C6 fungal-type domain-containing protein n=1 Tax=Alternaria dauci TaxID=48095 RepID=A0ABR3USD6_9PLEO
MVGVGGRSKACDHCKRRRIKCDLAKPQCGRCIKARLQCGGPRGIAIIQYGQRRCTRSDDPSPVRSFALKAIAAVPADVQHPIPGIHRGLSVFHDDTFTAFTLSNFLPISGVLDVAPGTLTTKSFLALATTYFGIKRQDSAVTQFGLKRYSDALGTVHSALAQSVSSPTFDLLEAIMVMSLIEFLVSDGENGWIKHARGLERLFEMRGSEAMASLPCLMILERTRPSLISAGLVLHKPTIMSSIAWKREPWCSHPERVDSLKLMFDILADCPSLFVLFDEISTCPDEEIRMAAIQNLCGEFHRVVASLDDWGDRFASDPSHTPDEIPAARTTPMIEDEYEMLRPAWSTVFQYQSLYHANAMAMYNATTILALRFSDSIDVGSRSAFEHHVREMRLSAAALSICRSVDYHQQELWGEQGSFALLFPLRMAYDGLSEEKPTVRVWLQSIMHDISAGRQGLWRLAQTLLELGR